MEPWSFSPWLQIIDKLADKNFAGTKWVDSQWVILFHEKQTQYKQRKMPGIEKLHLEDVLEDSPQVKLHTEVGVNQNPNQCLSSISIDHYSLFI